MRTLPSILDIGKALAYLTKWRRAVNELLPQVVTSDHQKRGIGHYESNSLVMTKVTHATSMEHLAEVEGKIQVAAFHAAYPQGTHFFLAVTFSEQSISFESVLGSLLQRGDTKTAACLCFQRQ